MRRHLLVLLALAAACFGAAYALSAAVGGPPRTTSALAAAPSTAGVVAYVDAPALRASSLWAEFFGERAQAPSPLAERCGFDPLEQIRHVAFFLSGDSADPLAHHGFLVRGDFDPEQVASCLERVVGDQGGGIRQTHIEGVRAVASASGPSVAAFLDRTTALGGDETGVREAILVHRGHAQSASTRPELAALWADVSPDAHLAAVGRVPPSWQEGLEELGERFSATSLADVQALGLGVRFEGEGLTLGISLRAPGHAAPLATQLEQGISRLVTHPLIGVSVLVSSLSATRVSAEGDLTRLRLRFERPQIGALAALLQQLALGRVPGRRVGPAPADALRAFRRPAAQSREDAAPPDERAPLPDETLRPAGASD